ncbi:MAG TPA: hypothetical protein VHP37_05870 [Burkholderiales bacterium]|nr:hypothetical protein [Burkholderiales bacterium]
MKGYAAFEDSALRDRLERLDEAEADLQKGLAARMSQGHAEQRWLRTDPLFQQLSASLQRVRADMRGTEEELLRREDAHGRHSVDARRNRCANHQEILEWN